MKVLTWVIDPTSYGSRRDEPGRFWLMSTESRTMALGVVAQQGNKRAQRLAAELVETFQQEDLPIQLDAVTGEAIGESGTPVSSLASCPLVTSIGGDGTFLFTARMVGDTPIVGVNLGEVGFLNAVKPVDATALLPELYRDAVAGTLSMKSLSRIVARGDDWETEPALNEILIHAPRRGAGSQLSLTISVNGAEYTSDIADGVLVSTPTGSSAYNLSEGGPLVSPGVPALIITEMSGFDPMPPLVVSADATVAVELSGDGDALIISDGREREAITLPTTVTLTQADEPVHMAGPAVEFFQAIEKLE